MLGNRTLEIACSLKFIHSSFIELKLVSEVAKESLEVILWY